VKVADRSDLTPFSGNPDRSAPARAGRHQSA
jgi:hypothetical protein